MTEDFIQKLIVSKQIMDKHNKMPRNQTQGVENFNTNVDSIFNTIYTNRVELFNNSITNLKTKE